MILLPPGLNVPPRIRIIMSFPTYFSAENPHMRKLSIPINIFTKVFSILKTKLDNYLVISQNIIIVTTAWFRNSEKELCISTGGLVIHLHTPENIVEL